MSDGGFIYEKITITSNSSAYATCDDWCVFVHLKRCEAFLRALSCGRSNCFAMVLSFLSNKKSS